MTFAYTTAKVGVVGIKNRRSQTIVVTIFTAEDNMGKKGGYDFKRCYCIGILACNYSPFWLCSVGGVCVEEIL